jgi:transposase
MKPRPRYPSDLNDAEWELIKPLFDPEQPRGPGRPGVHDKREIVNALFYLVRSGCAWRMLPHDLPPWQTVYGYFRLWRESGTWEKANARLREAVRVQEGHNAAPTAAVIDSQTAHTTEKGGSAATTGTRRSTGGSVISQSIPSACY